MPTMSLVRFTPRERRSPDEYRAFLIQMMPMYENADGLARKWFCASHGASLGVYEWNTRAQAEAFFDEAWRARMTAMAEDTSVEYWEVNARLNNAIGAVEMFV